MIDFAPDDDSSFVSQVTEQVAKGAATKRGINVGDYVRLARAKWLVCSTDAVFAIKILIDPLIQPEMAQELGPEWAAQPEPFCELVASVDSDGNLGGAPDGYVPPAIPGVALGLIPIGSPSGGVVPDPEKPADYIVAFLDVLGFESMLRSVGLEELERRYRELLRNALAPQSEGRPWSRRVALVCGEPTPGLMWLPIQTAYFSDSLVLWVPYHPGHVGEFLGRCSRVFCAALQLGIPLRGAVSIGTAVMDRERGVYLGVPLVEAARLEGISNWVGVCLGASWKSETLRVPVPPDHIHIYDPPLKDGGRDLYSGLVLDWPRIWRELNLGSVVKTLDGLSASGLPEAIKARYAAAAEFAAYSEKHQDWFIPPGARRLTEGEMRRDQTARFKNEGRAGGSGVP